MKIKQLEWIERYSIFDAEILAYNRIVRYESKSFFDRFYQISCHGSDKPRQSYYKLSIIINKSKKIIYERSEGVELNIEEIFLGSFSTLESAKRAAQEHFEKLVKELLENSPNEDEILSQRFYDNLAQSLFYIREIERLILKAKKNEETCNIFSNVLRKLKN